MIPDITDLHARLSVVESTVKRMDTTLETISTDIKSMKSYQDKQRGVIATLVIASGVFGAAITKVIGYVVNKVGAA